MTMMSKKRIAVCYTVTFMKDFFNPRDRKFYLAGVPHQLLSHRAYKEKDLCGTYPRPNSYDVFDAAYDDFVLRFGHSAPCCDDPVAIGYVELKRGNPVKLYSYVQPGKNDEWEVFENEILKIA